MVRTVVALNAHPDDEALLTGGSLARAAAAGHRVLLVTATDGDAGLADARFAADGGLGARRLAELEASAAAIGAADVIHLGYSDSGIGPQIAPAPPGRRRLATVDTEEVASALAEILRRERADLLLGYDAAGGYGHRDHVTVHHVARRAAALAGTPRLLEATAPREQVLRVLRLISRVHSFPDDFRPDHWAQAFTPTDRITHRIEVGPFVAAKRAAMAAHVSQTSGAGDGAGRNLAAVLRLPGPVFRRVFGREFFVDPAVPAGTLRTALFEDLE